MKEKINTKKIIELVVVYVITVAFILVLSTIIGNYGENLPTNLKLIISESSIIIPTIIYCIIKKIDFKESFRFRKIKVSTFFLSILAGFLVMPIASFINVLTQFLVPNTMIQASDSLVEGSKLLMILILGFFAPLCEEFVFRGLFHCELSKSTNAVLGMIISAVLFGIIHLNFNQLCYAIVLGLIFAWINNCSRSIYTSIILHTVVNTINALMMLIATLVYSAMGESIAESSEQIRTNTQSLGMIAIVYFIMAAIAFGLLIPCLKGIKKIEAEDIKIEEV